MIDENLLEKLVENNISLIDKYLSNSDWKVKENSNMSYSLQGLNFYMSSELSKLYWLNKIYPKEIKNAHNRADIHLHDLGLLAGYCLGMDLQDILMSGITGVHGKVDSAPAKNFRTILGQIANIFYSLSGECAGALAISNFDTFLAPFIRYNNLSEKEVEQALQEFVFNMNVPTRVGFQSAFTNVTLDLQCPNHLSNLPVIIGGNKQNKVYGDFQPEINLFNDKFLDILTKGDNKGRVFTFPIPTYNITKDFDWNNPSYLKLWRATAKFGIPSFSNYINSDVDISSTYSMCCRLRLNLKELQHRGGSFFGASGLTGSIGVVTINMPRLGYLTRNEDDFFEQLGDLMDIAKDSLEIKRKIIEKFSDDGMYPYLKFYMRNIKAKTGKFWTNHFSTIGLIGMNECCLNFLEKDITTKEGKEFSIKVLNYMRNKVLKYQTKTGNLYNLEATPGEGITYRFAKADKSRYKHIICANESDIKNGEEPFYTNSTHVPVDFTDDVFEIFDHQNDLQVLYTGGTTINIFVGEEIENPLAVKELVKILCEKYKVPYFTINPTFSVCQKCGYINGKHEKCPTCGGDTEVYSRIVGYLRPVKQWNVGKQAEFLKRKTVKV
jgi:ribonucleoside-triphosphate reductase (formate)